MHHVRFAPALLTVLAVLPAVHAAAGPLYADRSASLPVAHVYEGGWEHFVGGGVAVFDCNGDRYPELFAAGGEAPARLFLNETASAGAPLAFSLSATMEPITGVTGAWPVDVDGDGQLDLVVLRVGENRLLRGLPGCRFEDAPADWGFAGGDEWSTAFSATFEPGKDWPTLVIGNYVDRKDPQGPFEACDANRLLRPDGRRFGEPVLLEPGFCALSILISDELRTGRRDVRISNDRHYYVRGGAEQKLRLDTMTFLTEADGWPRVSLWGMGIAARDLTGDGRAEVMSTSMGDQLLQIATETGYKAAPFSIGTYAHKPHAGDDGRPSTGWHAQFGDVDNDGLDDLFIAKGNVDQMPSNAIHDPNNLLIQQEDGTFREMSVEAGVATAERSRGAALADLNNDGRLDLVVVNRRAPMELWENVTEGTGNWVAFNVTQQGANSRALGAFVELRTPAGIRPQEITAGGGHGGGQSVPLHFGLGALTSAEMRIITPEGKALEWQPVAANTLYDADAATGRLTRADLPR